jgi:hypothetical protein
MLIGAAHSVSVRLFNLMLVSGDVYICFVSNLQLTHGSLPDKGARDEAAAGIPEDQYSAVDDKGNPAPASYGSVKWPATAAHVERNTDTFLRDGPERVCPYHFSENS